MNSQTAQVAGNALFGLAKDQAEWSQATFGPDDARGPIGALLHLEKEAREAIEAIPSGGIGEELADCFLLILDASRRAGFTPIDLIREAINKQAINRQREWPAPTGDTPVEHVRASE